MPLPVSGRRLPRLRFAPGLDFEVDGHPASSPTGQSSVSCEWRRTSAAVWLYTHCPRRSTSQSVHRDLRCHERDVRRSSETEDQCQAPPAVGPPAGRRTDGDGNETSTVNRILGIVERLSHLKTSAIQHRDWSVTVLDVAQQLLVYIRFRGGHEPFFDGPFLLVRFFRGRNPSLLVFPIDARSLWSMLS